MNKSGLCGLLTVVALVCGCDKGTKSSKVEGETVESQSNIVRLETSMGAIVIELDRQAAPVTVKNFLGYVESGFYDGTIFHRVIPGFMIQGGGFTKDLDRKKTRNPIINEAKNGLSNKRGTIAMARTNDPNSATSQFFINHTDNTPLDYTGRNAGYAVFGKVTEGMEIVDAIAAIKTTTRKDKKGVDMQDVPVEPVVITSAKMVPQ
jgi:cyclophilin family peptidyl-prolyl cis-trans isomerase